MIQVLETYNGPPSGREPTVVGGILSALLSHEIN